MTLGPEEIRCIVDSTYGNKMKIKTYKVSFDITGATINNLDDYGLNKRNIRKTIKYNLDKNGENTESNSDTIVKNIKIEEA